MDNIALPNLSHLHRVNRLVKMKNALALLVVLSCFTFCVYCQEEAPVDCGGLTTCDACTDESSCVWCETDLTCVNGGFFGPSTFFPSCSSWRHRQCLSKYLIW